MRPAPALGKDAPRAAAPEPKPERKPERKPSPKPEPADRKAVHLTNYRANLTSIVCDLCGTITLDIPLY